MKHEPRAPISVVETPRSGRIKDDARKAEIDDLRRLVSFEITDLRQEINQLKARVAILEQKP